jgi:aminoglycoside phosphotransferase family enzyme/predicted kinase
MAQGPLNHPDNTQEQVFALLADPATHGGAEVKRIDTHAASVFLAGDRAYKVKRAVRFPFLDYSTLDQRKAACAAELEVNRAFAPKIYRRIVPITRAADGRLALDGEGEPVEWAVEMQRFDEEATLDRLAEHGRIDAALADRLGRMVAAAHRAAPVIDAEPWIGRLAAILEQNQAAFRQDAGLFPRRAAGVLDALSRAAYAGIRELLRARGRQGLVRRGHGDLHLGNIVLIDGDPVLFDAIEFDPLIAAGDVLYDLAFLLMDLVERDLKDAANAVLNRYLAETRKPEDLDALVALPFFLSLRAAIRAKVTAARLAHADEDARPAIARAARTYFDLACRVIEPPAPTLVAIGGLSGTGKSVVARALAPALGPDPGAVILRSDVERKALFAVDETQKLPADAYAEEVNAKIYARLAETARRVVAAGHSAIVDAVFARNDERTTIAAAAVQSNVAFRGLFLVADLDTRLARVTAREQDASDAGVEIARAQENYDIGLLDWSEVDASGTPEQTLAAVKGALS